jgi:hypothetical protein
MNRHMRRAAAKTNGVATLEGLAGIAERLQPYLLQIEAIQSQLEAATQLLTAVREENRALQGQIGDLREVMRGMFARGMDVPIDAVLLMEHEIQNALESPQSAEDQAADSST